MRGRAMWKRPLNRLFRRDALVGGGDEEEKVLVERFSNFTRCPLLLRVSKSATSFTH